jgi:tRNA 2-thiouridine synthesizing protein E
MGVNAYIEIDGKAIAVAEGGFLVDSQLWNERLAEVLAERAGVALTPAHWEIIHFIRDYYLRFNHLPNARMFVKAVQGAIGAEKGNSIYLHRLFPKGPVRYACLVAGLPKPPGCL